MCHTLAAWLLNILYKGAGHNTHHALQLATQERIRVMQMHTMNSMRVTAHINHCMLKSQMQESTEWQAHTYAWCRVCLAVQQGCRAALLRQDST